MFHSMSENPPHRVGKIFSHLSYWGKSTTFAPGREDWNLPQVSDTTRKFTVSTYNFDSFAFRITALNQFASPTRTRMPLSP